MGKAVKIEFVTSNLPACKRKADVANKHCTHFFTRGKQSITLGLLTPSGRPKYVKGKEPTSQPKD